MFLIFSSFSANLQQPNASGTVLPHVACAASVINGAYFRYFWWELQPPKKEKHSYIFELRTCIVIALALHDF